MKYYIYGLVDPRDYKLRYVGRTTQRMDKRLNHHVSAAKRGNPRAVYGWLRSLLPVQPSLVCLEICTGFVRKRGNVGWRGDSTPTEIKWIKRFRRDCLSDIKTESTKGDWKLLVNRDEAS